MRPLTVVQLLPALESGGVELSALEVAGALVEAGHRAIVVSAGGRLVPRLQALGAEHVTLDIGRKSLMTLGQVRPLRALLSRQPVDIVHVRSRLPGWVARLALGRMSQSRRPHLVSTVHGLNSPSRYSQVMTRGERVICVSDTVRKHVLRHYPGTDPDKLRVIPRGIDPARFPRAPQPDSASREWAAKQHPALTGEGPLLLLPGRGTRLKGHADALALLAQLRGDGLDARLWCAGARQPGREAYIAELEAKAAALGIGAAIAFTAPTDAIARAYAASDLVLQLSRKPEAFGRTVIEALSVGRPVLGWAHGGAGELLEQLQPWGAVPAFDERELHRRARCQLAPSPSPGSTAAAAMPAVTMDDLSHYTLRAMQQATLAVYAELID
ncbi:glycosyltransferase [Lysobacter sp. A289]